MIEVNACISVVIYTTEYGSAVAMGIEAITIC